MNTLLLHNVSSASLLWYYVIIINLHDFSSLHSHMISYIAGAVLVAYVIGKVSYQGACREKIMRLENSPLAEAMRKGKRGTGLLQDL